MRAFAVAVGLFVPVACLVPGFDVASGSAGQGAGAAAGAGPGAGGSGKGGSGKGGAGAGRGGTGSGAAGGGGVGGSGGAGGVGGGSGTGGAGGSKAGGGNTGGSGAVDAGAGGTGTGGDAGAPAAGSSGADTAGAGNGGIVHIGASVFHDSASGGDYASGSLTDATFAKPAGTEPGDLMLVFLGCDHGLNNITPGALMPKGWHIRTARERYGGDEQSTYLLFKFVEANEPDPIVFSDINPVDYGVGVQGLLTVYRGVDPITPFNAFEYAIDPDGAVYVTQATTLTPSITTTVDGTLLIAGLSPDSAVDAPTIATWPDGFSENPTSVTNPIDRDTQEVPPGWANIYAVERHLPKAQTLPGSAFVWDLVHADRYYGALSFVLALAPAPP